jgi:hypothetical protein
MAGESMRLGFAALALSLGCPREQVPLLLERLGNRPIPEDMRVMINEIAWEISNLPLIKTHD